ncbi:MAG TPA: hypothetical protein EYP85_13920 [Armatimonadetes bacterium]|nr:hypothetical protein [Armatimonadota bacterium]
MGEFKAGVAKVNITPPVGFPQAGYGGREKCSETVDDELYAKALVLEDGEQEIALVTTDLVKVPAELTQQVRAGVQETVGLSAEQVLLCASHTHFGPVVEPVYYLPSEVMAGFDENYEQQLARKIVGAVRLAHDRRRQARVAGGQGQAPELVFNRRPKKPDGQVTMSWRPPPPEEAAGLTWGPTDPTVGVLRVEDENGNLLAALINFACHPVCGVDRLYAISADYPGYAMQVVEQVAGGICLFALGCAGNVVPIEREGSARRWIGTALGAEALKVLSWLSGGSRPAPARLSAALTTVELPLKPLPTVEEAQREVEEKEALLRQWEATPTSVENISNPRGELMRAKYILGLAKQAAGRTHLPVEVQVLGIGATLLIGLPGEVFVELGLAIKQHVEAEQVFVVSLSNDCPGYVPTAVAYKEGGYEPEWTPLAPGAGEALVEAAVTLAQRFSP